MLGSTILAGLILALPAPALGAATFHVNSSGDPGDGTCDASCTLRDAVGDAVSGDAIVIDPGVNPSLTAGQIAIAENLSIAGQGAAATVDANDLSRVFTVTAGSQLALQDLRLIRGRAPDGADSAGDAADGGDGGAIRSSGGLSLLRVRIDHSSAGDGGDHTGGGAGSAGEGGDGGGVQSSGPVTIAQSTISENSAGGGGSGGGFAQGGSGGGVAIAGSGALAVRDSTFLGNRAGGGFSTIVGVGGDGGGIDASGSSLLVVNSTLTGNNAGGQGPGFGAGGSGGGIYSSGSTDLVISSTIAGNSSGGATLGSSSSGGGIVSSGSSTTLRNSVLANNLGIDNFSSRGLFTSNCVGTIADGGHNLSFPADSVCPAGFGTGNPLLAPLGNYGGPTETMALGPGSAAIDQVPLAECTDSDGAPLSVDQRGVGRPAGPACDIGAFEAPAPPAAPSPLTTKKKCKKAKHKKKRAAEAKKKKHKKKCKKRKKRTRK